MTDKRILILSDINSSHTQKWCQSLIQEGYHIGLFSLSNPQYKWYLDLQNIEVFSPVKFSSKTFYSSGFNKLQYLSVLPHLKKTIRKFMPHLLHAHYATSYGLLGALSRFHPFLISSWGSDIMDFPNKSFFHQAIIKYNLEKADQIIALSKILAANIGQFTSKKIITISWGVDLHKFKPLTVRSIFEPNDIVIGTVKSMEEIYNIDILIKAFAGILLNNLNLNLKLLLVGGGSRLEQYKQLVKESGIEKSVVFTGRIPHGDLTSIFNMIDIFVNVSRNESFGVSVLEASACGLPVVVSKVGGLIEVVEENKTGLVVEAGNVSSLCDTLEKLIHDAELRNKMGKAGREFVSKNYDWKKSVSEMESIYRTFLK